MKWMVVALALVAALGAATGAEAKGKATPTPTSGWTTISLPDGALDAAPGDVQFV